MAADPKTPGPYGERVPFKLTVSADALFPAENSAHSPSEASASAPATDTPKSPDLQRVVEALREIAATVPEIITHAPAGIYVPPSCQEIARRVLSSLPSGEGEEGVIVSVAESARTEPHSSVLTATPCQSEGGAS